MRKKVANWLVVSIGAIVLIWGVIFALIQQR